MTALYILLGLLVLHMSLGFYEYARMLHENPEWIRTKWQEDGPGLFFFAGFLTLLIALSGGTFIFIHNYCARRRAD